MLPLVWNFGPEVFHIGNFPLRYYSVFFALSFVVGRSLFNFFLKKEAILEFNIDKLAGYMIFATTLGARFGHVLFYEWNYFSNHLLEIIMPVQFYPEFKIIGFTGLASHGATVGIVLSVYMFSKFDIKFSLFQGKFSIKRKNEHTFLWLIDRLVICIALAGCFIRLGNFMNSEIYGIPTEAKIGVVFAERTARSIKNMGTFIEDVSVKKSELPRIGVYQPIDISIKFSDRVKNSDDIVEFLQEKVHKVLSSKRDYEIKENISHNLSNTITYSIKKENGKSIAIVHTMGVVRHPAQLYESLSCLLLFILLFMYWRKKKYKPIEGRLAGFFFIWIFSLRIFYENFKYADIFIQNDLITLTIPQALSIPAILLGIVFFFWSSIEKFLNKTKL